MSKVICHILLFIIVILALFGLLALPGLASEPKTSLIPSRHMPSLETSPRVSSQITFTPVVTVYLPIVLSLPKPPPGCDFYEPNDTPAQANLIQNGETQTHCIKPKTDTDWIKFTVTAESQMVLEASDVGGDLELRFYDSSLNELDYSYSWSGGPARISYECGRYGNPLPPGTYYAKVEHWLNWAEIDNYDISLSLVPCPTAVILPNYSHYTDTNTIDIVGEVKNDGLSLGMDLIKVTVNFFNASGQLVDTDYSYVNLDYLGPGDKSCFHIWIFNPLEWSYYEFETPTYSISSNPLPNLTIINDSGSYNPTFGDYKLIGQVRNDHGSRVEFVELVGTLYDASNTVVGCSSTSVNSTHLDNGQISSFEIDFYGRDYVDVTSYRLQVDGNPQ